MPRKTKTEQEYGYLRSFWDEIRVLQADYNAVVSLYCDPTPRPGVFRFRLVFTPLVVDAENRVGSSAVQFEFPTGAVQTLAGALWSHSMKLTTVVAEGAGMIAPYKRKKGNAP